MAAVPVLKEDDPMKNRKGIGLAGLVLMLIFMIGLLTMPAAAAGTHNRFILVVEAGGRLVVAPEYVTYAPGSDIREALGNSGHSFTGLEQGIVTAINGVEGSYTRSDQTGSYDLTIPASSVTHYRFSENSDSSQPSEGLMLLMAAMAEYSSKDADVRNAAKAAYQKAYSSFVGINSANAELYAQELNQAVRDYEKTQSGTKYPVSFTEDGKACTSANYSGISVMAANAYGKIWTDDNGDGILELPQGAYTFRVQWDGLLAEGAVSVPDAQTVAISLPKSQNWLDTAAFRLSGTYSNNKGLTFEDGEFERNEWNGRKLTVPVPDSFSGAVYAYAEYNSSVFTENNLPVLTAVYTMKNDAGTQMEKTLPFRSYTEGAYSVLAAEAAGNTVIYRVSSEGKDGYTYAQDYTVTFVRIPTLKSISLWDQDGTDLAATEKFNSGDTEYDYNVLDTTTKVVVGAVPSGSDYAVTIENALAGENAVTVSGETTVKLTVSANGYSNTYHLNIHPGKGSKLFFACDPSVSIEVVNQNGVVMPWTRYKGTDTKNQYQYILVPGDQYSYVATYREYYHIADEFKLEEVSNRTITVEFDSMGDWLGSLAFGDGGSKDCKGEIKLDSDFVSSDHSYQVVLEDTLFDPYIWVTCSDSDVTVQAVYDQLHTSGRYHGANKVMALESGRTIGTMLGRFLMSQNPFENTLTVRLSKEVDGVAYYQDYVTEFRRSLTMKGLTAQCDDVDTVLKQPDGTLGFDPLCREYNITVSMAADKLVLFPVCYSDNLCYGEETVGYRINVDGEEITGGAPAVIELDGTIHTQKVTLTVENHKSPEGTAHYLVNIQKSPPVEADFRITPGDALLNMTETLSGSRLWPDENGVFQLCEGYSYDYAVTHYGYVSKSGTLQVTRDESRALVIRDGEEIHTVTEADNGGAVTVLWELAPAPVNSALNSSLSSVWPNFRGNGDNNAVSSAPIPTAAEDGSLYWAVQIGQGIDSDAVGSPILADGDLITYAGDEIYRIDTMTGQIKVTGQMDHKSSFSITPPTYWGGMVFVALSDGTVQAFDAQTLESLWIYRDPLVGQPNCPITVEDGYLYTGFWNQESQDANFVCLSVTDEDPTQSREAKCASWYYTSKGGYYWAGAWVGDGYVLVGTDDGTYYCDSKTSRLLVLDARTGELCDSWDNLNGDIRSSIVHDGGRWYFTSKGGSFYSVGMSGGKLYDGWSVALSNGQGGIPMSTCSPSVYNGRAYVGVSGEGQFSAYSGHNITVIDLDGKRIAYCVPTQGYPQTSGLLTTAYDEGNGEVYVYFFDNYTPGKLRVLKDRPGQTAPDYITAEGGREVAYALFTPTGEHGQYAICSPIADEYGTVYFKNDSAHLMAFGSAVAKIEITREPDKMTYAEGSRFDPTGMKVMATYVNGLTREVTEYVICGDKVLTEADPTVTISFPYGLYHNAPGENAGTMESGVVTTTPTVELTVTVRGGRLGDVNGDDAIDSSDAQLILDYEAKKEGVSLSVSTADVTGDGIVDSNDAVLILRYANGELTRFPAANQTEETAD